MDLHIHDTHFIGLICGVPARVFSSGVVEGGAVAYLTTQYLYGPGGPAVSCSSGAVAKKGRPFIHGYEIYLERATLVYESGATPLTVLTADGKAEQPNLDGGGEPITAFTRRFRRRWTGSPRARSRTCSAASWRATRWCCVTRRSSRCGRGRPWPSPEPLLRGRPRPLSIAVANLANRQPWVFP